MNYVIADIHGDYEKYVQMLDLIDFQDGDTLYVLGDVIDRGTQGMKILQDMMLRPNVIPILGNHEYMASISIPWLLKEVTEESVENMDEDILQGLVEWMHVGGETSIAEFHKLDRDEQQDILEYLEEFSLYESVKTGGREFLLVHAGLDNFSPDRSLDDYDLSELIFHKPDYERVYFQDKYLVTGHTPTRIIHAKGQDEILEKNRHIAMDCGCGYGGKLGCICLETMEKFYI